MRYIFGLSCSHCGKEGEAERETDNPEDEQFYCENCAQQVTPMEYLPIE